MAKSYSRFYVRQHLLEKPFVNWASGDADGWAHVVSLPLARLIPNDFSAAVVQERLAAVFKAATPIAEEQDPFEFLHERVAEAFSR